MALFDVIPGKHITADDGGEEIGMGAYALATDGFIWMLWNFDARSNRMFWFELPPVAAMSGHGYTYGRKEMRDIPGRIIHRGKPGTTNVLEWDASNVQ